VGKNLSWNLERGKDFVADTYKLMEVNARK